MVFGKDVYDKKKNSTICKKLGQTIYKERLYYCEQIPNKTSEHSIIFILFNPSKGLTSPTAIALYKMSRVLQIPMEEFFKGIERIGISAN